jgi:phosphoglycerate dehydrogenase-like enzyme
MIQKVGQGVDKIDLEGARRRGIPVCNAGATNTTSVAEHTILLMLAVYKRLTAMYLDLRDGRWPKWEYRPVSHEISGKRIGIVGLGNIGRKVAQRLQGWECELAYFDLAEVPADVQASLRVRPMGLDDLLGWADIVTLHVFLADGSRHLIGARELGLMQPTAILVNAARGGVVDEAALIAALRDGRLAGAGLDVLAEEPTDPRNPLLTMDNVVVSAHVAGATWEALELTIAWSMENCARLERGERPLSIQNGV